MDNRTLIALRKRLERRRAATIQNLDQDASLELIFPILKEKMELLIYMIYESAINEVNLMLEESLSNEPRKDR